MAVVVATVLSALMVTGCSSSTPDVPPSPTPSPSVTAEGPWKDPDWAVPVVSTGTRLGEVSDKRIRIIVYQVAIAKAPTDSEMVDVSDGQPLIAKGDPIVLLRYVVTNISKDPINLGIGTVSLTTSYPDWSWNQGLVGVRAPELMARHKLFTTPFKDGTARPPYVLGPGESFMIGQNVAYEKAELLQITAAVVVSDNSGSEDASLSWTLKGSVHLL
ncbi:hypothetical protein [Acidipropionibacterium jensenii]|uniref:hypothetical protein n=1 Tax=Acidipropionibacterium jensenii TaxID=1749 RepID=UPI00214C7C78|nr:hypothetical protein [Acidipropionibacterium jensenii]